MKIKDGAILAGLDIRMRPALITADHVYKKFKTELVITEGLGGTHSPGSLHYYGLAIDIRIWNLPEGKTQDVYEMLKYKLQQTDSKFDIILHTTHIHIEYDVFKLH